MKEELLHITNVEVNQDNDRTATVYSEYINGVLEQKIAPLTDYKPLESYDFIYDKIINRIYELGILNRVNSDLSINGIHVNKNNSNSLRLLYENIEEITKHLLLNNKNNENCFLIMNEELYNLMINIINDFIPNIKYHKNNNIGNNIIIGIKNNYDEVGINVYINNKREYTIVEQGVNIEKNYYTIMCDLV